MNTAGWMLTENGRQPWIVQGIQLTKNGVSSSVSSTTIWISLIVFALLYVILAIVDGVLMIRYSRKALEPPPAPVDDNADQEPPVPAMSY
jgi:cytochrome bd ubiquinol oxidase subunit I